MLTLKEVLTDFAFSPYWNSEEKVNVDSHGADGKSPLHFMAYWGDDKAICLLVEAGAHIDTTDDEGNTPLHESVMSRQASATRTIIKLGANVDCKNSLGQTPFDIAKDDAYEPCIALLTLARQYQNNRGRTKI